MNDTCSAASVADGAAAGGGAGVDGRLDRQSRAQPADQRIVRVQADPHRNALHDLGKIAGGVVRWQQTEFQSAGRSQTLDTGQQVSAGKRVNAQPHRLTGPHVRELSFLEVGRNVDLVQGDQGHQLRARLHVLTDTDGARRDDAVNGRGDRRVAERESCFSFDGLRSFAQSPRLYDLCLQHLRLSLGGGRRRPVPGKICGSLARLSIGFLRLLQRSEADSRHLAVALAIDVGQVQCSQARGDARARPGNGRTLFRELRLQVADLGLAGLHVGARLIPRGVKVPLVKTSQHLAGFYRLMIFDQDLSHIA